MRKITSRQNETIKSLAKLKNKPGRTFLIEGEHSLELALAANLALEVFTTEEKEYNVPTTLITKEIAAKLSHKKSPSKVFAVCKANDAPVDYAKHLLYLDGVSDPGNVGTLLRSALAFDFGGVILNNTVHPYNEKVLASAQGAHFSLPIEIANSETLRDLKKRDYKVIVTTLGAESKMPNALKPGKYIVILGHETKGVSEAVFKEKDENIIIPIKNIDSLNVAVAGAILMYEVANLD